MSDGKQQLEDRPSSEARLLVARTVMDLTAPTAATAVASSDVHQAGGRGADARTLAVDGVVGEGVVTPNVVARKLRLCSKCGQV